MANQGVNTGTGGLIPQEAKDAVAKLNEGMGFLGSIWGAFTTGLDFLWNAVILAAVAWIAYTYKIMPDEWRQQVDEWMKDGKDWLGQNDAGKGMMMMLGKMLGAINKDWDFARNHLLGMSSEEFAKTVGDPAIAAMFDTKERRAFLYDNGITSLADALEPAKAKLLLSKLSTEELKTLFTAAHAAGSEEQRKAVRSKIDILKKDPEILHLIMKHEGLPELLIDQAMKSGGTLNDLSKDIKVFVNTKGGIPLLQKALAHKSDAELAALGVTRAELTGMLNDIAAGNPRGQALITLINADMLNEKTLALRHKTSLVSALDALRDPELKAKLSDPAIVGALKQVLPETEVTKFLFASIRNKDGIDRPGNMEAAIKLASYLDSGSEAERAQRGQALAALDKIITTGAFPAAGTPERAALQTFLAQDDNREALHSFFKTTNVTMLDATTPTGKVANLLAKHSDGVLKIMADPKSVKWIDENRDLDSQFSMAGIRAFASMPKTIYENGEAFEALQGLAKDLKKTAPAAIEVQKKDTPTTLSSLTNEELLAAGAGARAAGVTTAQAKGGKPDIRDLSHLPQPPREPVNALT